MAIGIVIDDNTVEKGVAQANPLPVRIKDGETGNDINLKSILESIAGFNIPKHDAFIIARNSTTDVYTFILATVTVAVVTINYSDSTKSVMTGGSII